MNTIFSDLCEKEVINCIDGSLLGYISDIEVACDDCRIIAIIVRPKSGIFQKTANIRIPCEKIEKFGIDVIIVNYCCAPIVEKVCDKPKRSFFG